MTNSPDLDFEVAPIADLLAAFRDLAGQSPHAFTRGAELVDRRPAEVKAKWLEKWKALVAALRKRATLDDVRPLFLDDDGTVRHLAGYTLGSFDEELGSAAIGGALYGTPTLEAFRLTRLARSLDSAEPPLGQMSEDQLVARFVDVAMRIYGTRFFVWLGDDGNGFVDGCADIVNRNHWVGEEILVLRELKTRGALARLIAQMDDPNPVVSVESATACLAIATDKALPIVEVQAAKRMGEGPGEDFECWAAQRAVANWRAGKPVIWGVV